MNGVEGEADRPVWGVKAISALINRTPRQTYHLLEKGLLPAKKVGDQWTAIPSRLRHAFDEDAA